jgi:hypothetical protein
MISFRGSANKRTVFSRDSEGDRVQREWPPHRRMGDPTVYNAPLPQINDALFPSVLPLGRARAVVVARSLTEG